MKRLALIAVLCVVPLMSLADSEILSYKTGNDIYTSLLECNENKSNFACATSAGYVIGVLDAFSVSEALNPSSNFISLCVPNVSVAQVVDVVQKYLEENPAFRHENAASLVRMAANESWPCPEE